MILHIHKTRDGTSIPISQMTDSHLLNTLGLFYRNSKIGIVVRTGGGSTPDEFWMDEELLYNQEARTHLRCDLYEKELNKRGLKYEV